VAGASSDQAWWAEICTAAGRHRPDAEARAVLSKVLFEDYPGFTFDRERTIAAAKRFEHMLEHLAAFEADYRVQFPPPPDGWWKTDRDYERRRGRHDPARQWRENKRNNAIKIERDLHYLEDLRRRTEHDLLIARTLQDANEGRRNLPRSMLYTWLCSVWIDHFGGELTYDRSAGELGGEPGGPLVEFILAAMRQVMAEDELPKRETVRDNIDRDRCGREELAFGREKLALQARNRGVGD
jgi:hypothetical protein